ncbi:MAG TPA: FAD binding domain-containing protein [Nevskiaceae bacterium]|nr:FAD binding domain-containing protein [Nevskiaceae bacterium]
MKPVRLDYVRIEHAEEIFDAFEAYGADARILAGGQSLMAMLNFRLIQPQALVDLSRCAELDYVRVDNGHLCIGAAATQASVEWRTTLATEVPLLKLALPFIAHFQIRNRGTVCGSIAHADPSAEIPLCLSTLGGEVILRSREGRRTLQATDFFTGMLTTAIAAGEFVEEARFPLATAGCRYAFDEVALRRGDFAIVAVAACLSDTQITLGVGGVADRAVRKTWPRMAQADLETALNDFAWELGAQSDNHASAAYRRHLVRTLGHKLLAGGLG